MRGASVGLRIGDSIWTGMSFVERRGFDCDRVGIPDVSWESRVVIEGRERGSLFRGGLGNKELSVAG